jgi:hypothetical protein
MRKRISSRRAGSCPTRYDFSARNTASADSPPPPISPRPNQPVVGFHFHDGSHEAAPVAAVGVAQRRLQRDRHRGGSNVADLHGRHNSTLPYSLSSTPQLIDTEHSKCHLLAVFGLPAPPSPEIRLRLGRIPVKMPAVPRHPENRAHRRKIARERGRTRRGVSCEQVAELAWPGVCVGGGSGARRPSEPAPGRTDDRAIGRSRGEYYSQLFSPCVILHETGVRYTGRKSGCRIGSPGLRGLTA